MYLQGPKGSFNRRGTDYRHLFVGNERWTCRISVDSQRAHSTLQNVFHESLRPAGAYSSAIEVSTVGEKVAVRMIRGAETLSLASISETGPEWREACASAISFLQQGDWIQCVQLLWFWLLHVEGRMVSLHSAVASYRDQAVIIVGPSGSGKSTLLYALAQRGATVFSDEMALFDRDTLDLRVLPRPVLLRPGGWELLGRPEIDTAWRERRANDPKCEISVEGHSGECPTRPALILLLEGRGTEPSLSDTSCSESIPGLVRSLTCGERGLPARLSVAGRLANACPVRRLIAGKPFSTADLILKSLS